MSASQTPQGDGWTVVPRRDGRSKQIRERQQGQDAQAIADGEDDGWTVVQPRDRRPKQIRLRQQLEEAQVINRPDVLTSRHDFVPPLSFSLHQKHDPILRTAKMTLGAYSCSTFSGWCNPLFVEPLFSSDAVFLREARSCGAPVTAMYAIGRLGLMARVGLLLSSKNKQVLVQDRDTMIDLEEWLCALPSNTLSLTTEAGYRMMLQWWKETSQVFPIMSLPAELRIEVLENTYGFDVYPNFHGGLGDGSRSEKKGSYGGTLRRVDPPFPAVLRLKKQIYAELEKYVLNRTCKCFQASMNYIQYLRRSMQNPSLFDTLQTLELDLSFREYIYFFAVPLVPFRYLGDEIFESRFFAEASALVQLPALKHMFLRFRAPLEEYDAWGGLGKHNGYWSEYDTRDWRGNYTWHISCQRLLIDWILTYAKDFLKQIRNVTLCGFIKNSTKVKWDHILKKEREGIDHHMSHEMLQIENWPRDELYVDKPPFSATL